MKEKIRKFLESPLPKNVGWPHILGSMLLAIFGIQFLSGILLSFVYAPSPLSAYPSVQYILNEMSGGAWLRGIHYWGASFVVVLLVLHMIRTFLYAAYRKPRQLTWIVGVLLFLVALAFAQTGYLLPWDQKAYWGTSVTVRIIETVPCLGPKIAILLKGGNSIGALTLSRFYSIHVVLLPMIVVFLIIGHLLLVRRHGITAPWTNTGEVVPKKTPFFPSQLARDATGMFLILFLLFTFAALLPSPLGRPADPADNTFTPRPDWYFLFLFQSLHYFPGKWEVFGTFVLPSLAVAGLFLLPYYDRNPSRLIRKRPIALLVLLIAIGTLAFLTYQAESEQPRWASWKRPEGILLPRNERVKQPAEVAGMYLLQENCFSCHSLTLNGWRQNLQTLTRSRFPGGMWLQQHLQLKGSTVVLSDKDLQALTSVLRIVADGRTRALYTIPKVVRFGGNMFFNKSCFDCHQIDGQGGSSPHHGPDLTLRLLRPKEWHMEHIRDAQSVVRTSKMPPFYHYSPYEYGALAEYILYLHAQ